MNFPICKIMAEGTKGSGMASFHQRTAIQHTDSIYNIFVSIIHFFPLIGGILRILADSGKKIVFFTIHCFDTTEITLPYTVQRLVFAIVISGFQSQDRNIFIIISKFIATVSVSVVS